MKIAVLGTRGFPGVQGGVEAHCEKLYPRLAKLGCEITVFTRKPYCEQRETISKRDCFAPSSFAKASQDNSGLAMTEGVNLIPLDCPRSKSFEAIIHTLKGVFSAKKMNPDILHIHAIGPSLVVPLARSLGLKVIMTNHGPDYKRKKWGFFGKLALKLGEAWGSRWANEIICISETIADYIRKKYKRNANVIPNGVEIPEVLESDGTLRKYYLTKGKYVLTVGRLVPEKGFGDLIDAFEIASPRPFGKLRSGLAMTEREAFARNEEVRSTKDDWKLVIVGDADHKDKYSRRLREKAGKNHNIVLTGLLTGKPLQELYSHAGLFVLPSYYEGLPIVLLEAMSYGILCLVSDIPANRGISLPDENYFPVGDIGRLSEKLREFVKRPLSVEQKSRQIEMLRREYDWDEVARRTLEVYRKVGSK